MNKVNFLSQQSYPLSSETGDFLQNMIILIARLSALGGTSYILSNCNKTGNNYAPGLMVVNGEILPFDGGVAVSQSISGQPTKDWAVIVENNDNVQVYDVLYPNAFTRRRVVCGMGTGQFDLKTLAQVSTIQALSSAIATINNSLATMNGTIAGKAPSVHNHTIAQVTGLTDALSGKSATGHGHDASEITNLPKGVVLTGSVNIGDCIGSDDLKTLDFSQVLPTNNYIVVGSLRSTKHDGIDDANRYFNNDNDVIWMVRTRKTSGFTLALHETEGGVQELYFEYAIIMI